MKRTNETTTIVKPAIELLRSLGCLAWRNNTGATHIGERFVRFGVPGLPDILGVLPGGRMLAIECKMPGGRLTDRQQEMLKELYEHGVRVAVVTDPERVLDWWREWTRKAATG